MGVVITRDDIRAYAEVNYIINHMNEKYREKVPEKLKTFFNEYKDPTVEIKINPYVPLQNQGLYLANKQKVLSPVLFLPKYVFFLSRLR